MDTQVEICVTGGRDCLGSYVSKAMGDLMDIVTSIDLKSGLDFYHVQPNDFDVIIHDSKFLEMWSLTINHSRYSGEIQLYTASTSHTQETDYLRKSNKLVQAPESLRESRKH